MAEVGGHLHATFKGSPGGYPLLLATLPLDSIRPLPFQRDFSDHQRDRLAAVVRDIPRHLNPLIAVIALGKGSGPRHVRN